MRAILSYWTMALACISLTDCGASSSTRSSAVPEFRDFYRQLSVTTATAGPAAGHGPRLTFSADGVNLVTFLRLLADKTGVSVVAAQDLDKATVSLELRDAELPEVLGVLGRRLNCRATRIGNVWFLGAIAPEDRGVLVRSVRRLKAEELTKVCTLFASEVGRQVAFEDGLVVVADRVEVLQRLAQALDQLEATPAGCWVVQLYLVSLGDALKYQLGLDATNTVQLSLAVANGASGAAAAGALNSILSSAYNSTDSRVIAQPLLILRDGATAKIQNGDDIPVPKKTVSGYGVVQTTGFDTIKAGLQVEVTVREETAARCQAAIVVDLSQVTGQVEDVPIVNRQRLEINASLLSGGVYLLGSLQEGADRRGFGGQVIPATWSRDRTNADIQLWARIYRCAGAAVDAAAAAQPAAGRGEAPPPPAVESPRPQAGQPAPATSGGGGFFLQGSQPVATPTP